MAGAAGRRNILRELSSLTDRGESSNFMNTSYTSNPTSPEESLIQSRGCQKKAATYKFGAADPIFFKTPTKSPKKFLNQRFSSPVRTPPTRSSPRKRPNATPERLIFNEDSLANITISPGGPLFSALSPKKVKFEHLQSIKIASPLGKNLKALSHQQLVEMIQSALNHHPETLQIFEELLPSPDLTPQESRLEILRHNIFKAYPRNVWGSQDGSFCFIRVRTHLEAFKKECLQICSELVESEHWPAVFDYIFMAYRYSLSLPNWSNPIHNRIKNTCLRQLASHCYNSLKKANLHKDALNEIVNRLQSYSEDSVVQSCIQLAHKLMTTAPLEKQE